jgi:hypothetical protein
LAGASSGFFDSTARVVFGAPLALLGPLPYLEALAGLGGGVSMAPAGLREDNKKDAEANKAINKDAARPTKKPTPEQLKEINGHIQAGRYQKALDKTVQYYGIDTSCVNGSITFDPKLTGGGSTSADRKVRFGPGAQGGHPDDAGSVARQPDGAQQEARWRAASTGT